MSVDFARRDGKMLRSDGNNRMVEICDTVPELHIDPFPAAIWAGFPVSLP